MSMNLHVSATKVFNFEVKGEQKQKEVEEYFDLVQTPTEATYKILDQENIKESYITWLKYKWEDLSQEDQEYVSEHISELEDWLKYYEGLEYEIEWCAL